MNSAGLKPSAAITRGMTDRQAAIVNSRWLRHSAAGVSEAPTPRALAASGAASKVTCGGQSRNPRSGAATPARRPREPKVRRRRPRRGAGWFRGRSPISLLLAS